ncbi:MAG: response regulator transcription factor [Chitinophagaceae bacterium]|nr:response regulator transcription factor [Chitinophagaceae bacterium]
MPKLYKVLLADDHILLRNALGSLIDGFEECSVIHLAGNGEEVKVAMKGEQPDIAILDLNMPRMDGYETAKWLHENHPAVKILILTMYDSEIALIRLLQAGVKGFLKKDVHPDELKAAIIAVANNGYYYSHNTTGKLTAFFQKTINASIEKTILSEVEIQFLKLASTDMTYKEIATTMHLTPRTVDNYRDALLKNWM